MKTLGVLALAICSAAIVALAVPAEADSARTITGELVQLDGSSHQFRIVGHGGSYTAPAGTDLHALDGKTVQVDLSSGGTVTQLTPVAVPINPVAHGWSTVRGELLQTTPGSNTFTFAGDPQVYTAPAGVSVASYAGHMVEAKLDETGRVTDLIMTGPANPARLQPAPLASACNYSGQTYSAGSAVCQSGTQYRCDGSTWQSLGIPCTSTAADAPVRDVPRSDRSCMIGDATVANGSHICRSGTTYRCDDGAWINTQAACR
jgi:hypothetical protein